MSTRGFSKNILKVIKFAKKNIKTVLLTRENYKINNNFTDLTLKLPSKRVDRI
jgi:phosphoheptose isomerase